MFRDFSNLYITTSLKPNFGNDTFVYNPLTTNCNITNFSKKFPAIHIISVR